MTVPQVIHPMIQAKANHSLNKKEESERIQEERSKMTEIVQEIRTRKKGTKETHAKIVKNPESEANNEKIRLERKINERIKMTGERKREKKRKKEEVNQRRKRAAEEKAKILINMIKMIERVRARTITKERRVKNLKIIKRVKIIKKVWIEINQRVRTNMIKRKRKKNNLKRGISLLQYPKKKKKREKMRG